MKGTMTTASGMTALISGASAGLGKDFARMFASDGHDVILVARRKQRLEELAVDLRRDYGVQVRVMAADLSASSASQRIYNELLQERIHVDFLVNSAGFGNSGLFLEQPIDGELDMVHLNVCALMHLTRLFVPGMVERGFGRVLNMGSTAGFQAGPFMATYYASKAFVNSFSEALDHELIGTGVTVTVSCPGPVATEFSDIAGNDKVRYFKGGGANSEAIARQAYEAMHKGKRMIVHGLKFKLLLQSQRLSPRRLVHSITASMNKP